MKNLNEYLNEQLNEGRKTDFMSLWSDENGDNVFIMVDVEGNQLEFEETEIEKLRKRYGVYDKRFIKAVFDMYPDADQLCIEYVRNNDENEPGEYIMRDEMNDGWQKA